MPGRTHDITAARRDHLLAHLRAAGLGALADLGFVGLNDDQNDPAVVNDFKATRAAKLTPEKLADSHHAPYRSRPRPARAPSHSTTPDHLFQDGACSLFVKYFPGPLILGRQVRS